MPGNETAWENLEAKIRKLEKENASLRKGQSPGAMNAPRSNGILDSSKESKAFFQKLLDAIPTPVFYKDLNGKYLGFNHAFEAFYGEKTEQLIGKTVFDISPPELAEKYHQKDLELFRNGGTQQYESTVKNACGDLRNVLFHKAVYTDHAGNINGLIGTILDITELKRVEEELLEAERKFSTLFHASPAYIALSDLHDGRFLDVNEGFTRITGYGREEVLGRTALEIGLWFDPQDRARFMELARQQGGFHEEEVRFQRKNGAPLFGIWSVEKIELGGKSCLISVVSDVTERKIAQEALTKERDKLRVALSEIKTLSGLLPICASCKKIRDDEGYWNRIETYIGRHSDAQFTHSICPDCMKKLYPDLDLEGEPFHPKEDP